MIKTALHLFLFTVSVHVVGQVQLDSIILIDSLHIYYKSDQFDLTAEHSKQLNEFFNYQETAELYFHIDSYTDVDGDESYNRKLSNRRTHPIVQWLKNQNIDENHIITKGHGEQFARNENEPNVKAKDRRSEIRVFQIAPYMLFQGNVIVDFLDTINGLQISIYDQGIKRKVTVPTGIHFSIKLPINREVELQFEVENYFPTVKTVKLSTRSDVNQVKIPMIKMSAGSIAPIYVQFVGGKSILLPRYEETLITLASLLKKSPKVCLELSGHIHHRGEVILDRQHISFGLSIARSLEAYNYLLDNGIDKDRLLARGYSNSQMKYPAAKTEAEFSANRRVEAKVISCDSTRLISNDDVKNLESYRILSQEK